MAIYVPVSNYRMWVWNEVVVVEYEVHTYLNKSYVKLLLSVMGATLDSAVSPFVTVVHIRGEIMPITV
jgi:hypothetical protein